LIGVFGFLIVQLGFGILLTKERPLDRLFLKNTNLFQRFTGHIPPQLMTEIQEMQIATDIKDRKAILFVGIFSIIAALFISIWKKEFIYPLLLFISGVGFILTAYWDLISTTKSNNKKEIDPDLGKKDKGVTL
jgi:hypothetical protein